MTIAVLLVGCLALIVITGIVEATARALHPETRCQPGCRCRGWR